MDVELDLGMRLSRCTSRRRNFSFGEVTRRKSSDRGSQGGNVGLEGIYGSTVRSLVKRIRGYEDMRKRILLQKHSQDLPCVLEASRNCALSGT